MTILDSGYVGIGTTSPRVQNEIYGTGQLTSAISDSGNSGATLSLSSNQNLANAGGCLLFGALNDSGNTKPQASIKSLLQNGGSQGIGDLAFSTRALTSDTGLTERMRITSAGNVGIGTDSPQTKLDVRGGAGGGTFAHATFTSVTNRGLKISTENSSGGQNSAAVVYDAQDGEYYGSHEFQVGGLEKMRIDSSGNVMLDVNNWLQGHVTQRAGTQNLIRSRAMGYPGYYGLQIGQETNHISLFIDPLSVAGGAFSGNVNELMLPNKVIFQQANAVTSPTDWLNGQSITLDNGKVGIGINTPSYKLDVESISDSVAGAYIQAGKSSQGEIQNTGLIIGSRTDTATGDYIGISFSGNASVPARGRAAIGAVSINGASGMDLVFMTRNAGDGSQLGSSDEKMRITSDGVIVLNPENDANGGFVNSYRAAINVGQSAVGISKVATYGGLAMVWMNYAGNIGYDLVSYSLSQVTVLSSQAISGGTSSRTYTAVSGILKLTMGGSDTYSVYATEMRTANT